MKNRVFQFRGSRIKHAWLSWKMCYSSKFGHLIKILVHGKWLQRAHESQLFMSTLWLDLLDLHKLYSGNVLLSWLLLLREVSWRESWRRNVQNFVKDARKSSNRERTHHKQPKQQNALAVSAIQDQKAECWGKERDESQRPHYVGVSCSKEGVISVLVPEISLIIEAEGTSFVFWSM